MANPFKEKLFEKKEPEAMKLKKLDLLSMAEHVEIKRLAHEDSEDVHLIMHKTMWEAEKKEIDNIVKENLSYGAYVERMVVAAGLAWAAHYDENGEKLSRGDPNSIYQEDVAILLSYEGRGIRKMLVQEREKAGKAAKFAYSIGYISSDWPVGSLEDMIRERGNKMEKIYLEEGYRFVRAKGGILAVKKL